MTGEGTSYQEQKRGRVQCNNCSEDMALGSLEGPMRTQHGRAMERISSWEAVPIHDEQQAYRMAFPTAGGPRDYPVEGCLGHVATRTAMRVHFLHRHVRDTVVILEEGNLPHPRCPLYNMLVPWSDLNRRHLATAQCARRAEWKRRRL